VTSREQQFVELYRDARVEDQRAYYERKAAQNEAAHRQLLLASAIVFGISGAVALLAGVDVPGKLVWAILAAVLPAITTAFAAYEGLFAFDRIARLFHDAARNLRRVQAPLLADEAGAQAAVARYVEEIERILERERGQWGQLAVEQSAPAQNEPGP
jgi:hypothetical protein